jgi:hypothetical protein
MTRVQARVVDGLVKQGYLVQHSQVWTSLGHPVKGGPVVLTSPDGATVKVLHSGEVEQAPQHEEEE